MSGIAPNPLNAISKVYLDQVAESAVPGKPAEKLKTDRAGYSIPKSEQESAAERIKKKTAEKKAALEKKHGMKMDDHPEYPEKKYVDEKLDPVGQEDGDVDNDGDKDKSDKYLLKRRKAISAAMKKRMKEERELAEIHTQAHTPHEVPSGDIKKLASKAVKRVDADIDGDVDKDDPKEKGMGEFVPSPDGKKKLRTKIGESMSNWRQDLSEVMDDEIDSKKIKEKKVNNKIKINPEFKESIEQIGGTIIEMVEIGKIDEAVKGQDTESRREAAAERRSGEKRLSPSKGKGYADQQKQSISYMDKLTKKNKNVVGLVTKEEVEQVDEGEKWIQDAIKKPGALKKQLGVPEDEKIPAKKLAAAAKKGGKLGQRARLAQTLKGLNKEEVEIEEGRYQSKHRPPAGWKPYGGDEKGPVEVDATAKRIENIRKSIKTRKEEVEQIDEKALSKAQQRFMGMVYAVKKGEMKAPSPEVAKAAASMTGKEAKDFAKTKHKGLPEKKEVKEQQEEDPKEKQMLAKKKQMMQRQYMLDKQRLQMQQQGKLPTGHSEKY